MGQAVKPAPTVLDAIEDDVEEAIRICDGDARLAVRGLILGQRQIKAEAERLCRQATCVGGCIEQAAFAAPWAFPADQDDLLRKAHALWKATCATIAYIKTASDDYKAAQTLAFGLVDFAKRISGGKADFAAALASTRATGPQGWHRTAADYEAAVDEAVAVCGGDPRAAIRSLIVMTEFLEAEAEGG